MPSCVDPLAEHGFARRFENRRAEARRHVPFQLRQRALQRLDARDEGRRRHRAGQQAKSLALGVAQARDRPEHPATETVPIADPVEIPHGLRAHRIVEPEHGGLAEDVRAAEAPGMARIALDLDRTAVDGGHEDAVGVAIEQRGRGVDQRRAGHDALRLAHVGHFVLATVDDVIAGREPRHRERCRHDLEETTPIRPLGEVRRGRILALEEATKRRRPRDSVEAFPEGGAITRLDRGADRRQIRRGGARGGGDDGMVGATRHQR